MCVYTMLLHTSQTPMYIHIYIYHLLLTRSELLSVWLILGSLFIVPADTALFIRIVLQRCRSKPNILRQTAFTSLLCVVARLYVHTRAARRGTILLAKGGRSEMLLQLVVISARAERIHRIARSRFTFVCMESVGGSLYEPKQIEGFGPPSSPALNLSICSSFLPSFLPPSLSLLVPSR